MVGMVVTISPSLSLYRMVVLPAASRPTCSMSFVRSRYPGDLERSVDNCVPSEYLQKTGVGESRGGHMTRRYNHVRISFLPKRPERSLETERPMVGVGR